MAKLQKTSRNLWQVVGGTRANGAVWGYVRRVSARRFLAFGAGNDRIGEYATAGDAHRAVDLEHSRANSRRSSRALNQRKKAGQNRPAITLTAKFAQRCEYYQRPTLPRIEAENLIRAWGELKPDEMVAYICEHCSALEPKRADLLLGDIQMAAEHALLEFRINQRSVDASKVQAKLPR